MFERFTASARAAVTAAETAARDLRAPEIGTGHLLLGVLRTADAPLLGVLAGAGLTPGGVEAALRGRTEGFSAGEFSAEDAAALRAIGIDLDAVRESLRGTFGRDVLGEAVDRPAGRPRWHVRFMPPAKKVLELSLREAIARKDRHIGAEHILLGLLRAQDPASYRLVTDPAGLRTAVEGLLDKAA